MNLLGLPMLTPRFRGKTQRLLVIYQCFLDHPRQALHPTQISRHTGLGFAEVNSRLEATPELFVKLPKRKDGITRYRLTSAITAQSPEEVERIIQRNARSESTTLWTIGIVVLSVLTMALIMAFPWSTWR